MKYEDFMLVYNILIDKGYVTSKKPLWDDDVDNMLIEINNQTISDEDLKFIYKLLVEELEEIEKNANNKYIDKEFLDERRETVKKIIEKI